MARGQHFSIAVESRFLFVDTQLCFETLQKLVQQEAEMTTAKFQVSLQQGISSFTDCDGKLTN